VFSLLEMIDYGARSTNNEQHLHYTPLRRKVGEVLRSFVTKAWQQMQEGSEFWRNHFAVEKAAPKC